MTKEEFDELYVGENIRVHCTTKELSDEFITLANGFGYVVGSCWNWYGDTVCYSVKYGNSCGLRWCLDNRYDVIKFKSLKEDLRSLLQVGRVVETRDGEMGFLLEDRILYSKGWDDLRRFDENLKHEFVKGADIVAIYNCPITNGYAWHLGSEFKMFLDVVWKRNKFEVSEDEKIILKNIDDSFKYVARNHNGTLYIYKTEPTKAKVCWLGIDCTDFSEYTRLFQYVKWEDKELVLIEDLLR